MPALFLNNRYMEKILINANNSKYPKPHLRNEGRKGAA
jgi:hypothetical protein